MPPGYLPAPVPATGWAGGHQVTAAQHLGNWAITLVTAVLVLGPLAAWAIRIGPGRWPMPRRRRRPGCWPAAGLAAVIAAGLVIAAAWAAADWLGHGRWLIAAGAAAAAWLAVRALQLAADRVIHGRRRRWLPLPARLRWHLHAGPGFARAWSLWRYHGLPAARKVASHARPSLPWLRRRLPGSWRQYAAFIGWAHSMGWPHRVYSHLEAMTLTIAPPQEGKSAAAAGTILDAPGPVVATSIRGDLIAATAGLRSRRGLIHIWNPEGSGDCRSTFAWNPVYGCADIVTAVRRAGSMAEAVTARGLSDEGFWTDQASMVLAACLHAAGLAGGTLADVHRWVLEEDPQPVRILARHPSADQRALTQMTQYLSLPDRTRAGISATINGVLKFMTHPGVVESVSPAAGEGFDFGAFLSRPSTLYLVASDTKTSPVSPLFVAICAELTHVARQIGGNSRPARPPRAQLLGSRHLGSLADTMFPPPSLTRLDPPLTMVLDELANIAPVPVSAWATWAAGSGICLHLYAQAWAQLVERWGEHGAATIWQACKTKVIYTATSEPELSQMIEDLCGQVRVRGADNWSYTRRGRPRRRATYEQAPVLPQAELRQLPRGRAVVIQATAKPTIVTTERVWKRADAKAWRRQGGGPMLPRPIPRPVPDPMPDLLIPPPAAPGQPAAVGGQADDAAAPPMPGIQNWATEAPRIPREVFAPPTPAEPPGPAQPRRQPQPPSRPRPWEPPSDREDDP